jgi:hypothetical protein
MECGCVSVSLLLTSPVQSTAVSCGDSTVDTVLSTSGAHVGDDNAAVSGGSRKPNSLDSSESSSSSKRAPNLQPVSDDGSANAVAGVGNSKAVAERIGALVLKQGLLERWLKLFVDESAVKRESIVSKFGRVREVLESAERAALSAYDEEVRLVVKSCEAECEGVEVLSQQLSACVLAYGGGVTMCDSVDDSDCACKEGIESLRSVNVGMCEAGLCEVLERCWSLVSVSSGDSDEEALRVAETEVSICDQVSVNVYCRHGFCLFVAVMLCLMLQLIPVISGHRISKRKRVQLLKALFREKLVRNGPGTKVTRWCGCVKSMPASIELFPAGIG